MVRIAPVRLQYNPKVLWFDPQDLELECGDAVIVKTDRGLEFGHADGVKEVEESQVKALKCPLKPVVRKATDEDLARLEELERKSKEALPVFKRLAAEHDERMHPVLVEYLFDEDKAIFFFESEERIDFRDLVRKLASEFHVRVDMRQIGVRDEARLIGGIGHCGQELCCKRLGGEFNPVTIRMAKEQDLSLNPQKISGMCGRLMCCLRYEFEAYKDFKGRAPKMNASIDTPCGCGKVCSLDCPREQVTVRMEEDGKRVTFPLERMDPPAEGKTRPSSIGEAFNEYADPDPLSQMTGLGSVLSTDGFTRESALASSHRAERTNGTEEPSRTSRRRRSGSKRSEEPPAPTEHRRLRRRRRSAEEGEASASAESAPRSERRAGAEAEGASKPSRRRRRPSRSPEGQEGRSQGAAAAASEGQRSGKRDARPGRKSSGLSDSGRPEGQRSSRPRRGSGDAARGAEGAKPRGEGAARRSRPRSEGGAPEQAAPRSSRPDAAASGEAPARTRRPRRRSHRSQTGTSEGASE